MDQKYTLLNSITLDAGSWAAWFSGTMSAMAVVLALAAHPLASRRKRREDKLHEKEVGRSVGWKLLKVLNATGDIDRHIEESLAKRAVPLPVSMKFMLVRPLGAPSRPLQEINQNETDFLLKAQAADLLAEIDMCIGRYASITYAMNEYKIRHEALFELLPAPVSREGMMFTHKLSATENEKVGPYAAMLEALVESIIELTAENMKRANAALTSYNVEMERYFGNSLMTFEKVASDELPSG